MSVYRAERTRRIRLPVALIAGVTVLVLFTVLSLAIGSKNLSIGEAWNGLLAADGSRESIIVWQLRMPRTLLAIVAGAALAVSGVLMQALTRNPLAEPGLLGVNAGAAFSVVIAISAFGATRGDEYLWFAFLGAGAAAVFVYLISIRRTQASDHARLVLAGVALTASLGACTRIITLFDATAFDSYRFWVIGSVANRGFDTVFSVLPFIAAGLVLAFVCGPSLNALALGDEQAVSLGVPVTALRILVIATITLLCGAATAAAGPIAFVGLVVPHVLRLIAGVDQRTILVLSALVGPSLMLAADVIGRLIAQPSELEVGVVTAFLGAPVLIALLLRRRPA
ncbi:FecCD family ABC transporter permease [Agreia pratensis]|uniref:FecCD family ABC transporter permease n=1 Tax=Agreia pratensis TaxID=150121 RepID=UPI002B2648DB|nr:iron ABC transporter permease [Agreia pratensis]